jgi:hypothetical protein
MRRRSTREAPAPRYVRPSKPRPQLEGERQLVVAFLRQLALDLRSPTPAIRAEADAFLHDQRALAFWTDQLDMDWRAFQQRAAQARIRPGSRGRPCV